MVTWRTSSVVLAASLVAACGGGSTEPSPATVSGRWVGTGTYAETGTPCEGEAAIVLQLTQTGAQVTGTLQGTVTRATATCLAAPGQGLAGTVSGTTSGGTIALTADGPIQFSGQVSGSSMTGTFSGRFQGLIEVSGRWSVTRE